MEHQLDLFDALYEEFKFDTNKPLRVVELFSGIGFQSMGMELAEVPYEVVAISEIDKFAILAYASIHTDYLKIRDDYDFKLSKEEMVDILQRKNVGYNFSSGRHSITKSTNIETVKDYFLADKLSNNLGDISLIKGSYFPKDIDVMTYSFPCTDLSKAGQQAGLGKGTRSGLVYEVLRILQELKEINNLPKMPIMENVVDLVQAKFVKQWQGIQQEIEKIGYVNYQQTLNAKEYGIAQNRDRVFMVSIHGDYNYNFPKTFELEYRLKDYLEDEVDESYYLSDKQVEQINGRNSQQNPIENSKSIDDEYMQTLTAKGNTSMNASMLLIKEATKQGYKEAYEGDGVYINRPHQKRGVVQDGMIQTLKTSGNDVGVVVSAKKELCNKMVEKGLVEEMDMIRHSYKNNRMEDLSRKENENNISATITTRADTLGVVVGSYNYGSSDNFMEGKSSLVKDPDVSNTIITSPNVGVAIVDNRFYRQALETLEENDVEYGNSINAYNKSVDRSGQSPTITTRPEGFKTVILPVTNNLRIRKLTPVETGRLMGMNDNQIAKQREVMSNAQMYKQHGNGIVAQVIGLIIGMAYYDDEITLRETVMANSHMWIKEKENKND